MTEEKRFDVVVVGAGMIGTCCALWLTLAGKKVLLIDKDEPGRGTSFGNACSIATYACVPINSPKLLGQLPSLLFKKDSPLTLDFRYALTHMPWMLRFLRNCAPQRVKHITKALGNILLHADSGLDPLLDAADARDLMSSNGFLNVYSTKEAFDGALENNNTRRHYGSEFEILNDDQIKDLEPNIRFASYRGLFYRNVRQVRDPHKLITQFAQAFVERGGTVLNEVCKSVEPGDNGTLITLQSGESITADKCVIACGAHSQSIAGSGTQTIPLDTERGYHIQYASHANLVSRPVGWVESGYYATPTLGGLRFAGTVEIAGLKKPMSTERIEYLKRMSHRMFSGLGQPEQEWLGYRPTTPDSLPVIGESPVSSNILLAYGHQHIGLTLGGITGKIISELIAGKPAPLDIAPYSPKRFLN